VTLPSPVAGFIGHINARIDLRLLEAIAERGMSLLLVGPMGANSDKERWTALLARPNVQWVGPKPFALLPGYMGAIDVGLVPYDDGAFNRGSFPLKTLEYLAAGRAVVSTGLPATRWLNSQFISIADQPGAFADAVQAAGRQLKAPADMVGRRAFAAGHDWALRARAFVAAIDRTDAEMSSKPV
jgi:glycosyltransferase involved in cell wall biosynthesis